LIGTATCGLLVGRASMGFLVETALVGRASMGFLVETALVGRASMGFLVETALVGPALTPGRIERTKVKKDNFISFMKELLVISSAVLQS